jgi:hypothetical protein
VAVTKADLFADDVEAAVHYYSPGSGSPFGDRLDELRALAGRVGTRLRSDRRTGRASGRGPVRIR